MITMPDGTPPSRTQLPLVKASNGNKLKAALDSADHPRRWAFSTIPYYCKWGTRRIVALLSPPLLVPHISPVGPLGMFLAVPVDEIGRVEVVRERYPNSTYKFMIKETVSEVEVRWDMARPAAVDCTQQGIRDGKPYYTHLHYQMDRGVFKTAIAETGIPKWSGKGPAVPADIDPRIADVAVLKVLTHGLDFLTDEVREGLKALLIHAVPPEEDSWESLLGKGT